MKIQIHFSILLLALLGVLSSATPLSAGPILKQELAHPINLSFISTISARMGSDWLPDTTWIYPQTIGDWLRLEVEYARLIRAGLISAPGAFGSNGVSQNAIPEARTGETPKSNSVSVAEPATMALLALGLVGLIYKRKSSSDAM